MTDSETWHRILRWNGGGNSAERLAAQVVLADGWSRLDPSHPLGGPDGKKDATLHREGEKWILAVYFPRDKVEWGALSHKFETDAQGIFRNDATGMVFVTNQPVTLGGRRLLGNSVDAPTEIYHLERVVSILDQPAMQSVRQQYLGIPAAGSPVAAPTVSRLRASTTQGWFQAREGELGALSEFLAGSSQSCLTIHGMPGVGKTALAQTGIERWLATEDSGVAIRIDLRSYAIEGLGGSLPSQYMPALAEMLGVDARSLVDPSLAAARITARLAELSSAKRRVVLLLDDVSDRAQISGTLEAFADHKVVLTTRDTWPWQIRETRPLSLKPLGAESARAALCSLSGRAAEGEPALDDLIKICSGLPVALNICGLLLKADPGLVVQELAEELDAEADRLDGLSIEDADLRALFAASFRRLDDSSRLTFLACGVFPGASFTPETAAVLAQLPKVVAQRQLRRLGHKHLIDHDPASAGWRMHDLLRLFAREQFLGEYGPALLEESLARLADHYAERVAAFNDWFRENQPGEIFGDLQSATAWLDAELGNCIAVAQERSASGDSARAWLLSVRLGTPAYTRLPPISGLGLARLAVASAEEMSDVEKIADALNNEGLVLNRMGKYDEAKASFMRARTLFRGLGHTEGEARVLTGLAEAMRGTGDGLATLGMLRRGVRLSLELHDAHGAAVAMTNLGIALREADLLGPAERALRDALALHQATGFSEGLSSTLGHLGLICARQQKFEEAVSWLQKSIAASEAVGHSVQTSIGCMNLGAILISMRRLDEAETMLLRAYHGLAEVPHGDSLTRVLLNLKRLQQATGNVKVRELLAKHGL